MTTIKEQLLEALQPGDRAEDLVCFYEPHADEYDGENAGDGIVSATFDELPERRFDAGYGGVEGEVAIAFSGRYVYVRVTYDGSEWFQAVPRHPEVVPTAGIPVLGG